MTAAIYITQAEYLILALALIAIVFVYAPIEFGLWLFRHGKHRCPDCASWISEEAHVCPHCEYRFAPAPTTEATPR